MVTRDKRNRRRQLQTIARRPREESGRDAIQSAYLIVVRRRKLTDVSGVSPDARLILIDVLIREIERDPARLRKIERVGIERTGRRPAACMRGCREHGVNENECTNACS